MMRTGTKGTEGTKMSASFIPHIYRPPHGLPLYWGDEMTGELPRAVRGYFDFVLGTGPELTERQFIILKDYLDHFIFAPCWTRTCQECFEEELAELRRTVKLIGSVKDIQQWNHQAMGIALDPF